MLAYLLATDPSTPADVLAYLAGQVDTPVTAQAVAANPNLPAGAHLHIPVHKDGDLQRALTKPHIPSERRQAFIDATPLESVIWHVSSSDFFTPEELTRLSTREKGGLLRGGVFVALARNPRTPTPVAADAAAHLYVVGTRDLLADVTTLRHHLPPTTAAAKSAAAHADPVAAYARQVLRTHPHPNARWWASTLVDFPHPVLTAAALDAAQIAVAEPHTVATGRAICRIVASGPRVTPAHRYRAAELNPDTLFAVENTAPDHVLRAVGPHADRPHGFDNPEATDATLRAMLTHPRIGSAPRYVLATIALHPAASPALRRDVASAPVRVYPWLADLVAGLNAGAPDAALELPFPDLLEAQDTVSHISHWAQAAWEHHHRVARATLEYAHALLTLEATRFPGTLRELVATARTIAT